MLETMTFSPVSLLLLAPVVAWAVWAVRRLVRSGLCDCHKERGRAGHAGVGGGLGGGGCAHCGSGCPACAMTERLEAAAPPKN